MDATTRGATATAALASFAKAASRRGLPERVRHEGKRSLLNVLGCALGVAGAEPVEQAVAVLRPFAGPPQATLVGRRERLDVLGAAFVNAIAGNLLDYDDTHLDTVIHPSAPVAPATLALGEHRRLSGAAVLDAFVLGAEVECRIGNGVSPGHYARGWHITATCGVFGSAVAAALLLDLPEAGLAHAIGIAASQSAGLVENLPTAAKNVGVGNAARNGLVAALMAQAGFEAAPTALEGPLGWARAMGDVPDVDVMLDGLGSSWELLRNTYKPYPSGIVFHAVTDACLALRRDHGLEADTIRQVTVGGDALLLARGDRPVASARDARVSIHHTAAVALLFGTATVGDYEAATVADPRVQALRAKVRAELAPDLPRGAARVEATLADGRVLAATVLHPRGSEQDPLSDRDLEAKARDNACRGAPGCDVDATIAAVWGLDAAADLDALVASLVPAG